MTEIVRKRGDTYADEIIVKSAKTKKPINITGYTFVMVLDPSAAPTNSDANVYSLDGVIVDAANGRVEFAPSVSQADRVGSFYYEVQMVDGAGRKRTILSARYKYVQDIVKA